MEPDTAKHPTRDDLLLPDHHGRLERLFDEVQTLARGDDARALCLGWARFDRELEAHLRAEERHLLPEFARSYPDEARALGEEHSEIRRLVQEIGVGIELHQVRAGAAEALIGRLREHAQREDALLYAWASQRLRRGLRVRPTLVALEQMRDQLLLKLHLGSMEVRDRFAEISREIDALERQTSEKAHRAAGALMERLHALSESLGTRH
jgi:hypothetical protein